MHVPLATHKYTHWPRQPSHKLRWWEAIVVLLPLQSEWKYCEVVSALEVRHNILSFIAVFASHPCEGTDRGAPKVLH